MSHRHNKTRGEKIFSTVNITILTIFALTCLIPFINIAATSFATTDEILTKKFILFPTTFTLGAYKYVLSTPQIYRSIFISIGITIVGTLWNMVFTSLMAYGLSRKYLIGRRFFNFLVVFTMLFGGGMIPSFLLIKSLGLINSYWALIIPGSISAMNMIILRNFFQAIPDSLEESAKMDGASDLYIFWKIMLPLALPSLATIALFYGVGHWNSFTSAMLYLTDSNKWPMQVLLRQIIILSSGIEADPTLIDSVPPSESMKNAVIMLAIFPMLCVYPFVQKYFIKGALIGSVKG